MAGIEEPILYGTTPEHPNMMGFNVTLTEPVDGELLRESVEMLRERFPYFYVRMVRDGASLKVVPNPEPVLVQDSWERLIVCSEKANYHLMAFRYEGKRLELNLAHAISDGGGTIPFLKSLLFCYLSKKTGEEFDPTGFKLPGEDVPESESAFPFDMDAIKAIEKPFYEKRQEKDFFLVDEPEDWNVIQLRLDEGEMIRFCKASDASPTAAMAVFATRALWRAYPSCDKTITCMIARDHKAMLGAGDNYGMYADFMTVDYPVEWKDQDIRKLCTVTRGQIIAQAQPENSLYALKSLDENMKQMDAMPLLEMKMGAVDANIVNFASFSVSYANSRSFGPLDPYIEELYFIAEPSVAPIICELSCINGSFFLNISQTFASETFLDELTDELGHAGITCERRRKEKFSLAGVSLEGMEVFEEMAGAFGAVIGFLSQFQ